jgi:NAD(P)-dependent dehydrogenase (short-subunit alcohol dehydrogenase family)
MTSPFFKMILFCLSQTAIVHGFRMISKPITSLRTKLHMSSGSAADYSMPDQQARFAKAKKEGNKRMLDTDSFYNPSFLKGKSVLVTGGNRGLGLAITEELVKQGAKVIITSRAPATIEGVEVISGIEMQDNKCGEVLAEALKGQKIDILINNAGYFYEPVETLESLNFEEELKMIDICAIGPLRITSGLSTAGLLPTGSKVVIITSQGGSVEWRSTQNPTGQDYGHHMSKSAANMMGKLLSQEMKGKGVSVCMLHPGFNKTGMTKKYEKIWEIEGAVDPSTGAKRVIHEIGNLDLSKVGTFINCEDGLQIPW